GVRLGRARRAVDGGVRRSVERAGGTMSKRAVATYTGFSAKRPRNSIRRVRLDATRSYLDGYAVTQHGIVAAYAEPGYARLEIVRGGRVHEVVIRGRTWTQLGLMREALAFARSVARAAR